MKSKFYIRINLSILFVFMTLCPIYNYHFNNVYAIKNQPQENNETKKPANENTPNHVDTLPKNQNEATPPSPDNNPNKAENNVQEKGKEGDKSKKKTDTSPKKNVEKEPKKKTTKTNNENAKKEEQKKEKTEDSKPEENGNLPSVSNDEIRPPENNIPTREESDNRGDISKGIISWIMIIIGVILILSVIMGNKKIPGNSNPKYRYNHDTKQRGTNRKAYYKNIRKKQ